MLDNSVINSSAAVEPHKPIIYERPHNGTNATTEIGQTIVFECRVRSDSQPHIQWLKSVNGSYRRDSREPDFDVIYVCCFLWCSCWLWSAKSSVFLFSSFCRFCTSL